LSIFHENPDKSGETPACRLSLARHVAPLELLLNANGDAFCAFRIILRRIFQTSAKTSFPYDMLLRKLNFLFPVIADEPSAVSDAGANSSTYRNDCYEAFSLLAHAAVRLASCAKLFSLAHGQKVF
jgi:hypothetical protein